MMEQRNLLIALVLSIAIITAFHYAVTVPKIEREQAAQQEIAEQEAEREDAATQKRGEPSGTEADVLRPTVPTEAGSPAGVPPSSTAEIAVESRQAILDSTPRIRIDTLRLSGSISLIGGRLDDLVLIDYRETIEPDSPMITLLSPTGMPDAYFAELGWVATGGGVAVPGPETRWQANYNVLTPDRPVTLTWDNGQGMRFSRIYTVDENYLFTVTQRVENTGNQGITLFPYALVSRTSTPEIWGFYILHEGPLGVLNGTLEEIDYDDLQDDGPVEHESTGGWVGITDKYWLVALVPEKDARIKARFTHRLDQQADKYQVDYVELDGRVVGPGNSLEVVDHLFAGAKEVRLLDAYAETYGIEKLDRAVVFRWLYFLAQPVFYLLTYINDYLGNFGLSILVLTILIKLLFFPLANKSYRAMGRMKKFQPQITKLRERYKDDKQKMQQEMMALYKREKVNPMAGCWPVIIQIPVFFCLYEVLFVTIEMRHAPFFWWIQDLSAPDPTSIFNLFGLLPFQPPDIMMIGAWPLIMGLSMYLMQKLNPQPMDPTQAKIFLFLPIIFTFILARFPSGLVVYWAWNNILSIAQQWVIMRRAVADTKT